MSSIGLFVVSTTLTSCRFSIFVAVFKLNLAISALLTTSLGSLPRALQTLFSINLRVSIASLFMFFVANMFDIYLYEKIRKRFPKMLWLRNNVSTIISNCLENYFLTFIAFIGIFDVKTCLISATIASLFEMIIAICDTSFLYLSKKLK